MTLSDTLPVLTGDENTPLSGIQGRTPLRKDSRSYVRWPANFCHLAWFTVPASYVNILLVFVPLGIIAGALSWKPTAVFVLNFLAIIPLAALLTFASEELLAKLCRAWRGLLNAIFVNAVKLCES
jgi:Ca2+:H+ antiporter